MAIEGVAGFIEGGAALHSGPTLRRMVNLLVDGKEGVLAAGDCVIKPLSTPGGSVRMTPGLFAIKNKSAGAYRESYTGSASSDTTVAVAPNNGSTTRYDLVVLRVENPYAAGETWPIPTDPAAGPYVFLKVIQGVPSGTRKMAQLSSPYNTQSAYPLAIIAIPANTATIQAGHITNISTPIGYGERNSDGLAEQAIRSEAIHCDGGDVLYRENTSFKPWPAQASAQVAIPSWATGVDICLADVKNAYVDRFDNATGVAGVWGEVRLSIGGSYGVPAVFDENINITNQENGGRFSLGAGGTQSIPAAMRGTSQTVRLEARSLSASNTAHIAAKRGTYFSLLLVFKAAPEYN